MKKLIALHGPAGSGKSFAADILVREFGYTRMKFAAPLKGMLSTLLSVAGVHGYEHELFIEGDLKEQPMAALMGKSSRHAMVTLGTEWGRNCIHPDLWVNLTMPQVIDVLAKNKKVVLDDCRFENEAMEILKLGGSVVKIYPDGLSQVQRVAGRRMAAGGLHVSERGIRDALVTHHVNNNGISADYRLSLIEALNL